MSYCPECGTKLREGVAFCHSCGTKIKKDAFAGDARAAKSNSTAKNMQAEEVSSAKKTRSTAAVVVACLLTAASFCMAVFPACMTMKGVKSSLLNEFEDSAYEIIEDVEERIVERLSDDDVEEWKEEYDIRIKASDVKKTARECKTIVKWICEGKASMIDFSNLASLLKKGINFLDEMDSSYGIPFDYNDIKHLEPLTVIIPGQIILLAVFAVVAIIYAIAGKGRGFSIAYSVLMVLFVLILCFITAILNMYLEGSWWGPIRFTDDFHLSVTAWPYIAAVAALVVDFIKTKTSKKDK